MIQITNSPYDRSRVATYIAVAAVATAPLLFLPSAADPFQVVRLVWVALGLGILFAFPGPVTVSRRELVALVLGAVAVALVVASAADSLASSTFGIHGRFQGLAAFGASVLSGCAGIFLLGRSVRGAARWIAAAVIVQAAVVVFQSLVGAVPVGTIGNQVLVGAWMAVGTAVAVAGARVERGTVRMFLIAAAVAGGLALGLIGSRGAWVGLAAGLAVVLVAGRPSVRRMLPVLAVAVLLVGAALLAGGEAAAKLDPSSLTRGSAASRWQIWVGTTALIADRPLLGVGPGRFLYEYPAYQTEQHALLDGVDVRADVAHSHLLQTAAEAGVPAAVALAALAILALVTGVAAARRGDAVALIAAAGFAAYLGQGLFGIGAIETDVLGWLLGGVALSRGSVLPEAKPRVARGIRIAGTSMAAVLLAAGVFYVRADLRYASGLTSFSAVRFTEAYALHTEAVDRNPFVDTYRVAVADAALYGGGPLDRSIRLLDEGLDLEPASYDLTLARARLLRATGSGANEATADAYIQAAALYPLGVVVRTEAIPILLQVGREAEAEEMAQIVLTQLPDDPVALSTVGGDEED